MTPGDRTPPPGDPVLRDDELLEAIGHGEAPPADDPVAALLADWRARVVARAAALDAGPSDAAAPEDQPRGGAARTGRPGRGVAVPAGVRRSRPAERRHPDATGRPHRRNGAVAGATLALVALTGGLWLGSARAEPGGPLWPVTEVLWTERAESLVTEREIGRTLEQARRDLTAARYADARAHLERAAALLADLGDDERRARLRCDIDDLWRRLPPSPAPDRRTVAATAPPPSTPDTDGEDAPESALTSPSAVEPAPGQTAPSAARPDRPLRPTPTTPGADPGAATPITARPEPPARRRPDAPAAVSPATLGEAAHPRRPAASRAGADQGTAASRGAGARPRPRADAEAGGAGRADAGAGSRPADAGTATTRTAAPDGGTRPVFAGDRRGPG
ncbi:hypothetical protein GA0070624_2765 [Micromonospora rhizosphaerae]|uniref:Anti-sigma-D factor RsdA to sigma factor binding region n=1 Tax=Micromonospora rhizosphaerae TaxID=568872 RepID=A0A1C6S2W1_9ACTN|nr:hypothetical protein [Micromonospora rhizosphaerae]SCL23593.1 hypothetical protein GA0070624_2765 [Micromonospora rhizosphaerae]